MLKKLLLNKFKKLILQLYKQDREEVQHQFNRTNPFFENLIDWKEKGEWIAGKGKNVTIYDSTTIIGKVSIGENTWIGPFCSLDGTGEIKIGANCSVATGCHILSHDTVKWALSGGNQKYEYSQTTIGDNCFLGCGSIVVKGVKIGNSCLIGAGSVVTKAFENNSIIAGVPAKKIGKVIIHDNNEIELHYYKKKS